MCSTAHLHIALHRNLLSHAEPFIVAFVKTMYTIMENESALEVCVNLTNPEADISGETVDVIVFECLCSTYIPRGARLASKPSDF